MNPPEPVSSAYLDHLSDESQQRLAAALASTPRDGATPTTAGALPDVRHAVQTRVESLRTEIEHLTEDLHAHPELAHAEHRSVQILTNLLAEHDIDAEIGAHGVETAFRAEAGSTTGTQDGPTIAILAEYDALPELGHACGHNVIAASALAAFLALALTHADDDATLPGRVVLLGTPAEEGYSGKEVLARAGAFDGVDAAIMAHPYGYDLADQTWLGRRLATWTFTGASAHASAQPFMGRNALDAATLAYQGIGLLRQQLSPVDRVHAVIEEGGRRPSIITSRTVVKLYARSKYPDTLRDLSRRLDDVARGAALMSGTQVEIDWDEHPPALPLRTNTTLLSRWVLAQRARARQPLPLGVVPETIAASTDFGNVSYRVPGIHPLFQITTPDVALHTREFAEAAASPAATQGALDAACGLAAVALDFLHDEVLRAQVAAEFEAQGGAVDVPHYFD